VSPYFHPHQFQLNWLQEGCVSGLPLLLLLQECLCHDKEIRLMFKSVIEALSPFLVPLVFPSTISLTKVSHLHAQSSWSLFGSFLNDLKSTG